LAFTVTVHVTVILMRHVLPAPEVAAEGALEQNTETVGPNDDIFKEVPRCAVCLQHFDHNADGEHVIKTKPCNHAFHRQCLKNWLLVNSACPLCRADLGLRPAGVRKGSHCAHGQGILSRSTEGVPASRRA
jgi:hypothetical protein